MITLFCIRPKGFNIGNDVIFLGLRAFLQEAFGRVVNLISLPATSRYESQAKAGLTAKTIHEINQYGHGVIVGGGNLYENGELEVNLDALETLEVPLMLFSLSRGRIYNRQHRLVTRTDVMSDRVILALNRKARYSLGRDEATTQYLRHLGCDHVQTGGCPSIFLNRMADRLPKLSTSDEAGVLISVRNPALMNVPLHKQAVVYNHILEIIEFLRGEGHRNIRLLCHDHRDISFAASFQDMDYVYADDVYTYLALLRSCVLNVSYRLHSVLPCLAFGTPTIKISYDERALSLMKTIGFDTWNIDMIQSNQVIDEVIDRYRHLETLKTLHGQAQPTWNQLETTMKDTFHRFATDVMAYS